MGCGSKTSVETPFFKGTVYEPWLCRALLELGARPVGVDRESNSKEEFESYQVDLNVPNSLSFLERDSFDIANMRGLLTSNRFNASSYGNLLTQLERIVKGDGYLIYSDGF